MPEPCRNHAGTVWNGLELAGIAEAARNCPKLPEAARNCPKRGGLGCPKLPETARNGLKRAETG